MAVLKHKDHVEEINHGRIQAFKEEKGKKQNQRINGGLNEKHW